ncbi:MAG TPA: HYR domain-containing protein, partial [Chitinophagales bacterium]|nr:HYR domain-containing protein [Chitinophagales bacterium]
EIVMDTAVYACPSSPAIVTADSSFTAYHWSNGDTTVSVSALPGTYTVTVTNSWGCKYASPPVVVSTGPDVIPPVITCPGDTVVYAPAGSCTVVILNGSTASAFDNCSSTTITNNAPSSYAVGVTNVTWTAKDAANNAKTCVQHVTVYDSIPPYFTATPADPFVIDTITADNCSSVVPDFRSLFAATDSCSVVSITQSPAAGTFVNTNVTPIAITATDVSGNYVVYYMLYQSNDTVTPVIACPGNISTTTTGQSKVVTFTAPTQAINCTNTTVQRIAGLASGSVFPVGVTTETYVVTDGAGAADTCSFSVTVTHITGVNEVSDNSMLSILPVPATDHITVTYQNKPATKLLVKLMNTNGQIIDEEKAEPFNGSFNKTFNMSILPSGTYLIELITDSDIITRKVIKL